MVSAMLTSLVRTARLLSLAGCDGDTPRKPSPSPTVSTSSSQASSSPTEPAVPPRLVNYDEEQRAAYAAAVEDYEQL